MKTFVNPERENWTEIIKRPAATDKDLKKKVRKVLKKVRKEGDAALKEFAIKWDKAVPENFIVSPDEFAQAEKLVSPELKNAIGLAAANIRKFHESQVEAIKVVETMEGVKCWRRSIPIEKVGFYIPGGTAPLFSTILMLGIPALIAGCREKILCTPVMENGKINPVILYTASIVGISKVYKIGGAQAIAAMAFGTESVPAVYKIFGPGNAFVTEAKSQVSAIGVAIDMPAGPSELLVWADESAESSFIAADLLSQAEHGTDSQVVLVSSSVEMIDKVKMEVERQLENLERRDNATASLVNSLFVNLSETLIPDFINLYAPEHLIISHKNEQELKNLDFNAGSVFIGKYSAESFGDYASGTNHTLPTYGYAKSYSGVSVDSFVRKVTFQEITEKGVRSLGPAVELMAEAEGLQAHKNAVSIRLKSLANV